MFGISCRAPILGKFAPCISIAGANSPPRVCLEFRGYGRLGRVQGRGGSPKIDAGPVEAVLQLPLTEQAPRQFRLPRAPPLAVGFAHP
jgi:hypothetical protein